MWLKRQYDQKKLVRDESGKVVEVKPNAVKGIKVLRAGPRQHFSQRFLDGGISEGWLSIAKGLITIGGVDGPVKYRIERAPGHYCCHCHLKLDDSPSGQAHVKAKHGKSKSPDTSNPAGYRKDNFFACVKEGK